MSMLFESCSHVQVSYHDRLKRSHAALEKQAGGLSEEYNRATKAMNTGAEDGPSNAELKQRLAGIIDKTQALQVRVFSALHAVRLKRPHAWYTMSNPS